ncbi:hypothetical protein DJ010_00895 [Nocardioides silvaticus]|uniref:Uncharacterized protein n=1 Tax=Nocardioides silvaticus TaxID=2201891 RepID=A0A316TI28_9ACTN|nr:hypothetical protein [Nocardioides silvaticus]PWN04243.1 hypothetical protein DJ010_00895 [Nocardioides silvaticus]
MSDSQRRVDRALAWRDGLPPDGRPTPQDVEVAARLCITDPYVMARLLWDDQPSLGRHFDELAAVIRGAAEADGSADERVAGRVQATAPPRESRTRTSAASADSESRVGGDLDSWLESLRASGESVPIGPELAATLRGLTSPDDLRRVTVSPAERRLWRDFVRRHEEDLLAVLGLAPTSTAQAPAASVRPTGPVPGDAFAGNTDVGGSLPTGRRIRFTPAGDDGIRLTWDGGAEDGQVRIFRLGARDDTRPWNLDPHVGVRVVGATHDAFLVDDEPFSSARRFYAVAVQAGATEAEARAALPVWWAEGVTVQPVRGLRIRTTGGQVSAGWQVASGIERVEVLRVPVDEFGSTPQAFDVDRRISGDRPGENLSGFVDDDVEAGSYEYRMYACATVDGRLERSLPVTSRQTVQAELPVVSDLLVEENEDGDFVITWTPLAEAGLRVEIHALLERPPEGLGERTVGRAVLEREGAFSEDTVVHGSASRAVRPRLPGEDRLHFTAVTASRDGALCRVGPTVVHHRAGAVRHVQLVERVDEQFLSFAWPDGAGLVKVLRASAEDDHGAQDFSAMPVVAEIRPEEHRLRGGVHLDPLPSEGAVLYVVGISFHATGHKQGPPYRVTYPGLTRLDCDVVPVHGQVRRGLRRVTEEVGRELRVTADLDVEVPLVLVRREDRLPLHLDDGERIETFQPRLQRGEPKSVLPWPRDSRPGFVRLFVDLRDEQERYAVLDPPLSQLRGDP